MGPNFSDSTGYKPNIVLQVLQDSERTSRMKAQCLFVTSCRLFFVWMENSDSAQCLFLTSRRPFFVRIMGGSLETSRSGRRIDGDYT